MWTSTVAIYHNMKGSASHGRPRMTTDYDSATEHNSIKGHESTTTTTIAPRTTIIARLCHSQARGTTYLGGIRG